MESLISIVIVAVAVHYIIGALTMRVINDNSPHGHSIPFWLVLNGGIVSAVIFIVLMVVYGIVDLIHTIAGE